MDGTGDGVDNGLIPSLMGKLAGIGPPDGVACWPIGETLICGLIGLGEPFGPALTVEGLGESDGLIGSGM